MPQSSSHLFSEYYESSVRKIYDFLYYRTFDVDTAEDLTADTFRKAFQSFHQFHGTTEKEFISWVYTIAYRTLVDHSRTDRVHDSLEYHEDTISDTMIDQAQALDNKDKLAKVLQYLDTLPPKQKDIILMAIWDDLPYKDISDITGESLSNIKKIISRTLPKIAANVTSFLLIFLSF
jgi:RNA polymerase sigma-70 factor, ECF subfamily